MPEMGLSGSEGGEESSIFPYPYPLAIHQPLMVNFMCHDEVGQFTSGHVCV